MAIGGRRYGFEPKVTDAPGATRSMRAALSDLWLTHLWVIYPGSHAYERDERLSVPPLRETVHLPDRLDETRGTSALGRAVRFVLPRRPPSPQRL